MEAWILGGEGRRLVDLFVLEHLCSDARSIEELLPWVEGERRIHVARASSGNRPRIEFAFMAGVKPLALFAFTEREVSGECGKLESITAAALSFDDQDGFRPDPEWFDRRNDRLGLRAAGEDGVNAAPPAAVMEIVLSYASASGGEAQISADEARDAITIRLAWQNEQGAGWQETLLVDRSQLIEWLKFSGLAAKVA